MVEGDFVLDGYAFGSPDSDVIVLQDGFDTGAASNRTQDAEMPRADGVLFGRDYLDSPTWAFTLGVRGDAYETLTELATVWRADHIRTTPGAVSTLRFMRGGREYVVFGRPRRFAVVGAPVASDDWQTVEADFKLLDPYVYSGDEQTLSMGLVEDASTGGVVLPETLPWILGPGSGERKGIVTVEGYTSTPLTVRIYGPTAATTLTNPTIKAPGFTVQLNTSIAPNQVVTIDTLSRTVMSDGVSLAGYLSPDSRLGTRLLPGSTEFTFTGNDPSYTSRVEFLWRSAAYSI